VSKQIPYDREKPYNQLPLLPPEEEKIITIRVMQALNNANRALAELKGLARKLPNQSMLVNTIALREAKASTEIENIFTTDDELYKSLTYKESDIKGGAKEVLFYRQALWSGYHLIKKNEEFSNELIVKVYQIVKEVNDSIRPDQTETVIMKRGSGLLGSSIVYTPPRGKLIIQTKLDNLYDYLNNDDKYPHDPLIKLAISHYQFEAIHPFRDGNGRAGRILSILYLIQKRLLEVPILYLSAFIIKQKEDYYDLLNRVTTRMNWEDWIIYMLKSIEETSLYTIRKIEEIDKLFNTILTLVNQKLPHIRKETVEKLFEQPYISPKTLIGQNIKSLNTAKKYLTQLEIEGVMLSKKIGKEIIYLNIDLYNLLSES